MMSQRVCAKILEFVFGRSIATKSLEEVGIVFRDPSWNTQFLLKNPVGNSPFRFTAGPADITLPKAPAERR